MTLRPRLALTTLAIVLPLLLALLYLARVAMENEGRQLLSQLVVSHMENDGREACERSPATWRGALFPGRRPGPDRLAGREPPPDDDDEDPAEDRSEERRDRNARAERAEVRRRARAPESSFFARRAARRAPPRTTLYALDAKFQAAHPSAPPVPASLRAELEDERVVATHLERANERFADMIVRMPWTDGPCAFVLARRAQREPALFGMLPPIEPLLGVLAAVLAAIVLAAGPAVRRIRALEREVRAAAQDGYKTPLTVRGGDEIAQLARAFDDAGREVRAQIARQAQREQSLREFLANTTHDVNTPLTVLLGHLAELENMLGQGSVPGPGASDAAGVVGGAPASPARERVAAALREAHYMASLLHNLSLAARLDAGEPDQRKDPVDLSSLVERAVSRHRALADRLDVALERAVPEGPLVVAGDVTMIEQAASNLIQNAVRHNKPGGHVAVILEAGSPGVFSLRVLDDGPGIPEDELPKILDRNYRGRSARTRDPGGLGLGLDITRRVADHHGFRLALRRSEMGGLEAELSGPLV